MKTFIDKFLKLFSFVFGYIGIIIYPKKCMSCGDIIDENEWLCEFCKKDIVFINPKKRCLKCGREKEKCVCKKYVYHFEGLVSVFANNGIARAAFYRYKLSRKMLYADYFALVMAKAVKEEFSNIKFDYICCVPQTIKSYLKRGFEQSNLLAQCIAENLEIPMKYDILGCREKTRSQHKSSVEQRAANVKSKYYCNGSISGTVLLVDDIVTTGYTIDECARQLLFAGADKVYCVSALISDKKVGEKNGS